MAETGEYWELKVIPAIPSALYGFNVGGVDHLIDCEKLADAQLIVGVMTGSPPRLDLSSTPRPWRYSKEGMGSIQAADGTRVAQWISRALALRIIAAVHSHDSA
jgi:hypothetical protein